MNIEDRVDGSDPLTPRRSGAAVVAEVLERRRLLSEAISIAIPAGQTYQLTGDLTDFTSLDIHGAGPTSVLQGNGFQIANGNLAGNVSISNIRIENLGRSWIDPNTGALISSDQNYAINVSAINPGSVDVSIQDTIFDASSSVYIWNGPGSTATIRRVTVLDNSLAPGGVTPSVSAPFLTARGPSTAPKVFEANRIFESSVVFDYAQDWQVRNNVIAGNRGGLVVQFADHFDISGNYIHTLHDFAATNPENPYGGQVCALTMYADTNVSTHDNVLRDSGLAMVRGLYGEFANNVLLDLLGGEWITNPQSGAQVHHNLFVGRYDGFQANLGAGIRMYDPATTGVNIYNNTFDGRPNFYAAPVSIGTGVTLASLRNNIFYRFPISWPWGNAAVRPDEFENSIGVPPRPAVDADRITYANDNAFYNPSATPGTADYAVGVDGAAYGSPNFGSRDLSGVDPQFASPPPIAFPYSDDDIKSGAVTVQQILNFYRNAYSLSPTSPLVGRNIGAVPRDLNGRWTGLGSGSSWDDAQNWSNGALPGPNDDVVVSLPQGSPSIHAGQSYNVRSVNSNAALMVDAALSVAQASQFSDVAVGATGSLTLGGDTTFGAGGTGSLSIGDGGRVNLGAGGHVLNLKSLAVAGAGKLDLNNGALVLDYIGGTPLATLKSLITSAYSGGNWSGSGLTSSVAGNASGHLTALGYAEASQVFNSFPATFRGQSVDNTSVLVRHTLAGDSDLSGTVDLTDFTFLAQNFNGSGKSWVQGDYNYDGSVDLTDFTMLAANFNQSLPSSAAQAMVQAAVSTAAPASALPPAAPPAQASQGLFAKPTSADAGSTSLLLPDVTNSSTDLL